MSYISPRHAIVGHSVPSAQAGTRFEAIDSAKGIGIVLVVFGHAWRGAEGAGLLHDKAFFAAVDFAVYAFHMPLFFFLSGLLFLDALQKHAIAPLFRGRITRMLWPMVLWSWIFFGLKLVAGQAANNPVTLADFPVVPLPPYEHLWFLWALFSCQSILILVYAVPQFRFPELSMRRSAAFCAIGLALLNPLLAVPSDLVGPFVEHAPYFLAGIAAGGLLSYRVPVWAATLCGIMFILLLWTVQGQKPDVMVSLALVVLAWTAWQCIQCNIDNSSMTMGVLCLLGQASMAIYLTHTVFSAFLRIALLKLGLGDPFAVLLLTVVIGLVAPLVLLTTARQLRLTKALGL